MSFFEVLKRLAQGKQPFEAPKEQDNEEASVNEPAGAGIQRKGPKRVPQVVIEDIDTLENGSYIKVLGDIQNNFDESIELDKVQMFGTSKELDTTLRPGEQRQFVLYQGNRITSNNNNHCDLYYKDRSGDYFCAYHYMDLEKESDNNYIVDRIRFVPPVKDV